jgi:hypothetical protein
MKVLAAMGPTVAFRNATNGKLCAKCMNIFIAHAQFVYFCFESRFAHTHTLHTYTHVLTQACHTTLTLDTPFPPKFNSTAAIPATTSAALPRAISAMRLAAMVWMLKVIPTVAKLAMQAIVLCNRDFLSRREQPSRRAMVPRPVLVQQLA